MNIMRSNPLYRIAISAAAGAAVCLACAVSAPAQERVMSDTNITAAVIADLRADNEVTANQIDVTTIEGIVTLEGTVDHLLAKERAEKLASAILGVRSIVNRIQVEPVTARTDPELERAVNSAWISDPATESYELDAEADNGIVTLSGTVESYAEKNLAERVAKGVRGVKGVQNNIDVNYAVTRPDMEIRNEIEARLENDIRVDDFMIDVEVDDGNVTLSGTVGSLQEKNQAAADAWVAGVNTVRSEPLDVTGWSPNDTHRRSTFISKTDEEIKDAVKDALLYDPRVVSFNPDVSVSDGTVTLSGVVDSPAAKRAAEKDARNTLGVWRVNNNLRVEAPVPEDDELEKRVSSRLLEDPVVERYDVEIDAYNGWVYLSGDVNTSYERSQAQDVAEKVKGVLGVVNNIDYDMLWTWQPDWEIRADILDQLKSNAFVQPDEISVSVDDGVATLNGTVESWSEYDEAEKSAFQGGAKDVDNNLIVEYRYYGPYGPTYYGSMYYHGPGYFNHQNYRPFPNM